MILGGGSSEGGSQGLDQNKKKSALQDLGWGNYCQSYQGVLPGDGVFSVSPSPGVEAVLVGKMALVGMGTA